MNHGKNKLMLVLSFFSGQIREKWRNPTVSEYSTIGFLHIKSRANKRANSRLASTRNTSRASNARWK